MAERHLFICNTPFQIMMALAFKMSILEKDDVEVIISNIIYKSEELYENICKSKVFAKVHYLTDYEMNYEHELTKFGKIRKILFRRRTIENMIFLSSKYDAFYSTDTNYSAEWIYEVLLRKNPMLKMYYFEEGPVSVLCDKDCHFGDRRTYGSLLHKVFDSCFGIRHINGNYSGAYISVKEQMKDKYFPWYNIPVVPENKRIEYVGVLNEFWSYKDENKFKNKLVFLEESFFVDEKENKDMKIMRDILEVVPKEKIIVKLHPRTRENRFANLNIETYQNTTMPWELIALNNGFEESVLVCYGSGAILHPTLYWGVKQFSIALLECADYHFNELDSEYYRLFSKICRENGIGFLPVDKEEFLYLLKRQFSR